MIRNWVMFSRFKTWRIVKIKTILLNHENYLGNMYNIDEIAGYWGLFLNAWQRYTSVAE